MKLFLVNIYNKVYWGIYKVFFSRIPKYLRRKYVHNLMRFYRLQLVKNQKQKGWMQAIRELDKKNDLIILETGRIRHPKWKGSDGNSTYFFSKLKSIRALYSVDNDSENGTGYSTSKEYCLNYLPEKQLKKIVFLDGHSVDMISKLDKSIKLDVVLLDSANDPELIFNEFNAVKCYLNPQQAVLIIDDVAADGFKGDVLIPFLVKNGYYEHRIKAIPNDCSYFIIQN